MKTFATVLFILAEVNRIKIIQYVVDPRLTTQMDVHLLGISDRQCRRLLSRYREHGPLAMANHRRGKPSNNQLPEGLARYALNIIRERYTDFGPTLACEKLAELHDVHLSKETVRSLMVKAGLWIPRTTSTQKSFKQIFAVPLLPAPCLSHVRHHSCPRICVLLKNVNQRLD